MGPETFDEIDAATPLDPQHQQRARLITATHEAGHAVIGTIVGFESITVQLCNDDVSGVNSLKVKPTPGDELALMLVAGYAAVEVLHGEDAKQANLQGDQHHLPDSDLMRGLGCAEAELSDDAEFDDQLEYLRARENEVLGALNTAQVKDAVKHAAAELYCNRILQPSLLGHICNGQGL